MTSRLRSSGTNRCVSCHTSGGRVSSGRSLAPPPRKRNSCPPGFTNACRPSNSWPSTRTARSVSTSCASCRSARVSSVSYRQVSTAVRSSSSRRQTSRKNAAFRAFASTMRRCSPGAASFMGIAGDPPPDPISTTRPRRVGSQSTAMSGSTISRSRPRSRSSRAVRFILSFQRVSSSTYVHRRSTRSSDGSSRARPARRLMRSLRTPRLFLDTSGVATRKRAASCRRR